MTNIKIAIVDDHKLYRETFKKLIQRITFCQIVAEATNGLEFLSKLEEVVPDVVFMDVKMPVMNGISATRRALEMHPQMKVVGLSIFEDEEYEISICHAGAVAFCRKDLDQNDFQHLILNLFNENKQTKTTLQWKK